MTFESKLRRIGNSLGVLIPKQVLAGYNEGDLIRLDIITDEKTEVKVNSDASGVDIHVNKLEI